MATLRIYLKEDWRKSADANRVNGSFLNIDGHNVVNPATSNPYIQILLKNQNRPPDSIIRLLRSVSIHAYWTSETSRRTGVYERRGARAELDRSDNAYSVTITSPNFEPALDLYRSIRAGTIRPTPGSDYDAEQIASEPTSAHRRRRLMRPMRSRPPRFSLSSC